MSQNNAPTIGSISGFAAYIPVYEGGNSVTAIKKDGQAILIGRGIKSVINMLLKESSIDFNYLRKNFGRYIGVTNIMPIPLRLGTVLLPVKVRKTIGTHDGCYAYIDLSQIDEVREDKGVVIKLRCSSVISCLENIRTIRDRMDKAKVVEERFASRMMGELGFKDRLNEVSSEFDRAATKGDITMLAYEIMKLRDRIR